MTSRMGRIAPASGLNERRIVDGNGCLRRPAAAQAATIRSGPKVMVARVPWPGALSMASVAPLAVASAFLSGSPSPNPTRMALVRSTPVTSALAQELPDKPSDPGRNQIAGGTLDHCLYGPKCMAYLRL